MRVERKKKESEREIEREVGREGERETEAERTVVGERRLEETGRRMGKATSRLAGIPSPLVPC